MTPVPSTVLLLGGTGDLASRHLLPALAHLGAAGRLPGSLRVVGAGRHDWDTAHYRRWAAAALDERVPDLPERGRAGLLDRLHYAHVDVTSADELRPLLTGLAGPAVAYLALPHTVFAATVAALGEVGLPAGSRLVVEKPFGTGLAAARELNELVRAVAPEESVFRVDHFLAKATVLNLLGLRFANRVLEPLWSAAHVQRVDIVWDETLGLEGRAGYYDRAGALRDMVQNHLLQLLCLVAMEPPTSLSERDLRDRKLDVLRAVPALAPDEVAQRSVRARYTAGRAAGWEVPDYVEEPGVDPARGTETFAEVRLQVDNWRWAGVPFVLRSGKALGRARREIAMTYRPVPHLTFRPEDPARPNVLRLSLDPDRIALEVALNGAGDPFDLAPAELAADFPPSGLPPYAQVLAGVLDGDAALSIRGDEAEESWRIVEPVLDAWGAGVVPLLQYPAGSVGPTRHVTGTD